MYIQPKTMTQALIKAQRQRNFIRKYGRWIAFSKALIVGIILLVIFLLLATWGSPQYPTPVF